MHRPPIRSLLRPSRLPAYALYGEPNGHRAAVPALDPLHCESIAERSRLHGWEIRPHRHEALFQLLVIEHGGGQAVLDGARVALRGPAVVSVPALAAHGFVFAPAVQGSVFTVAESHLAALLQPHPGLADCVLQLHAAALPAADSAVLPAAAALRDEALRHHAGWRGAALDAALLHLAVVVARARAQQPAPPANSVRPPPLGQPHPLASPLPRTAGAAPAPRALQHVHGLRALVEAQFRHQPSQALLAAQLGITPTQLNRASQQVLGHRAQAVLHARLLLQAQRELAYTGLGIKQIAFELGFTDAAYFTRFFRRLAGCPPAAWRAAQRGALPPAGLGAGA